MDISIDKLDLKPNQAVCFNCGNVLTSNDQYDMVTCSCGAMAVDGGDHLRIIEFKENPADNLIKIKNEQLINSLKVFSNPLF